MKKYSIHDKTKQLKVNPDYFTGKVILKEISSIVKSKEQKIYHVTFKKGGVLNLGRQGNTVYLAWDDSDTV